MKSLICTMALLCSVLSAGASEATFSQAHQAYDDGRYAEAVMLYEQMLKEGISNTEIHYNLANACFKDGDLPTAVWHYRKAWYSAPRDPDIRANLHFALNAAGAIEPAPPALQRLCFSLSLNEWIMTAIAGYIAFTLLLILSMLFHPAKRALRRMSLLPAALILISVGGWRQWHQLNTTPEWVVVKPGATALFGPLEGSTAHYKIPLGALVRQKNTTAGNWIEIEYDGKSGWVKNSYISRVYP